MASAQRMRPTACLYAPWSASPSRGQASTCARRQGSALHPGRRLQFCTTRLGRPVGRCDCSILNISRLLSYLELLSGQMLQFLWCRASAEIKNTLQWIGLSLCTYHPLNLKFNLLNQRTRGSPENFLLIRLRAAFAPSLTKSNEFMISKASYILNYYPIPSLGCSRFKFHCNLFD